MTLAQLLRAYTLGLISAAVLLALGLMHLGAATWVALLAALVFVPALTGSLLLIEFLTGAMIDRPAARLRPWAALRLWANEVWVNLCLFGWRMPWRASEAAWPEPPITPDPQRRAVLLIHGYLCNRAVWAPLMDSGLLAHCNVATVNLEPVFGSIDAYATLIDRAVTALRQHSGASQVSLVCHSMGGVAARAYLRQYGSSAIEHVYTLASPHAGTVFAHLGLGTNARQLRPGSDYLMQLDADTAHTAARFTCIGSVHDNLIVPRESVWWPGAQRIEVERVGHLALLTHRPTLKQLAHLLASAPARS